MSKELYVGNLSYETTEQEVEELFGTYGAVSEVKLIRDRETGRLRGFGFVSFNEEAHAQEAQQGLHSKDFKGRPLTVNPAQGKKGGAGGGAGGARRSGGGGGRFGSGGGGGGRDGGRDGGSGGFNRW